MRAHTNRKQSFEASQSIRGIASRVAFLFAARRRRSSRTTADPSRFSFLRAPQVDRCFPLEQAVEGHDYLEAGKSRGKVLYEI